jgi:hypothetical protein
MNHPLRPSAAPSRGRCQRTGEAGSAAAAWCDRFWRNAPKAVIPAFAHCREPQNPVRAEVSRPEPAHPEVSKDRAEVSKPSSGVGVPLFAYHLIPFGLSLSKARSISHEQRPHRTERAHERAGSPLPCWCVSRGDTSRPSRQGLRQAQAERGGVARQLSHAEAKQRLRYAEGVPCPELRRRISPNGIGWRTTFPGQQWAFAGMTAWSRGALSR